MDAVLRSLELGPLVLAGRAVALRGVRPGPGELACGRRVLRTAGTGTLVLPGRLLVHGTAYVGTLEPARGGGRRSVEVRPLELGGRAGTLPVRGLFVTARLVGAPAGGLRTRRTLRGGGAGQFGTLALAATGRRLLLRTAPLTALGGVALLEGVPAYAGTLAVAGLPAAAEGTGKTAALTGPARSGAGLLALALAPVAPGQRGTRTGARDLAARATGTGGQPSRRSGATGETGTGTAGRPTAAGAGGHLRLGRRAGLGRSLLAALGEIDGSMTSAVVPPESEGRSWMRMPCRRDRRPTTNRPMRRETETSTVGGEASRSLIAARSSGDRPIPVSWISTSTRPSGSA